MSIFTYFFTHANVSFPNNVVCQLDTNLFPSCSIWLSITGTSAKSSTESFKSRKTQPFGPLKLRNRDFESCSGNPYMSLIVCVVLDYVVLYCLVLHITDFVRK